MNLATWLGVGVWLGVLASDRAVHAPALWASLATAGVGLALLWQRGPPAFAVGLFLGFLAVQRLPDGPALRGPASVHGVVVGAPVGGLVDVAAWRVGVPHAGWRPAAGRIRVRVEGRAPNPGAEIVAWGDARAPHADVLPGAADLIAGLSAARVRTELRVRSWAAVGAAPRPDPPVPSRHVGVLRALAIGDRTLLEPAVTARLRATGTSHLLAISGFHVGVVAGVTGGAVTLALRAAAILRHRGFDLRLAWVAAAAAAVGYAALAGAPTSAQRAALLVVVAALVRVAGARPDPLPLLGLVAAALLVADPAAAWSPGFQLSFGAVVGLARLAGPIEELRPRWWPGVARWAWSSLAMTTAATVGTLPAAGWWFQALAPTSLVANLVAVPATTFVLAPLAAAAVFGPPPLDAWAIQAGDVAVEALMAALGPLETAPIPIAWGPAAALALALACVLHRRWAWALAVALAVAPPSPPPVGLRVTWPAVGQGSCALVEWPDGRRWLVDGGPDAEAVARWLRRRGVRHLDVVVAAHARPDHAGGLAAVVQALPVGEVWVPRSARGEPPLRALVHAALARRVPIIPGPDAELGSLERATLPIANDRSIVLLPRWDDVGVLLPADIEADGEAAIVQALRFEPVRVVAAAVPHHGARTSSGAPFVDAVRPPIAVVQAGRHHTFRHPAPEVVARWTRAGARLWNTAWDGTVEVTVTRERAVVRTWRWDRGWRTERTLDLRGDPWRAAGTYEAAPGPLGGVASDGGVAVAASEGDAFSASAAFSPRPSKNR